MTASASRILDHDEGRQIDVFLGESITTDAVPMVIFISPVPLDELTVIEIDLTSLVRNADASLVGSIHKRGFYARAVGGELRLINTPAGEFIGDIKAADADVVFGVSGDRFTLSARGKAATSLVWSTYLTVLRNKPI